eukprot:Opistho-1_new@68889
MYAGVPVDEALRRPCLNDPPEPWMHQIDPYERRNFATLASMRLTCRWMRDAVDLYFGFDKEGMPDALYERIAKECRAIAPTSTEHRPGVKLTAMGFEHILTRQCIAALRARLETPMIPVRARKFAHEKKREAEGQSPTSFAFAAAEASGILSRSAFLSAIRAVSFERRAVLARATFASMARCEFDAVLPEGVLHNSDSDAAVTVRFCVYLRKAYVVASDRCLTIAVRALNGEYVGIFSAHLDRSVPHYPTTFHGGDVREDPSNFFWGPSYSPSSDSVSFYDEGFFNRLAHALGLGHIPIPPPHSDSDVDGVVAFFVEWLSRCVCDYDERIAPGLWIIERPADIDLVRRRFRTMDNFRIWGCRDYGSVLDSSAERIAASVRVPTRGLAIYIRSLDRWAMLGEMTAGSGRVSLVCGTRFGGCAGAWRTLRIVTSDVSIRLHVAAFYGGGGESNTSYFSLAAFACASTYSSCAAVGLDRQSSPHAWVPVLWAGRVTGDMSFLCAKKEFWLRMRGLQPIVVPDELRVPAPGTSGELDLIARAVKTIDDIWDYGLLMEMVRPELMCWI